MQAPLTHCASVEVPVLARVAFEFMADGEKQSHWALGAHRSLITLLIWRTADTSQEEWDRTAYVWPTEVQLIKSRIEYELGGGAAAGEEAR